MTEPCHLKSFLPVCHKAEWLSSSIGCDPLLFGLSSRLCFIVFLSFPCPKNVQKIKRENNTISWEYLNCRLTKYESSCWPLAARTYFDLKMENIPRTQCCQAVGHVLSSGVPTSTGKRAPNGEGVVGEAVSDCRKLSPNAHASLAKPERCANRLIGRELPYSGIRQKCDFFWTTFLLLPIGVGSLKHFWG